MPMTWSAKLILSTSTKGSAKNSASHRNGTPITVVRPEGTKRENTRASMPRGALLRDGTEGVEGRDVLMSASPLLREHDAAGGRPRHIHVVVPGRRAFVHQMRAGQVRHHHLAAGQAHVIERIAAHVGHVRHDAARPVRLRARLLARYAHALGAHRNADRHAERAGHAVAHVHARFEVFAFDVDVIGLVFDHLAFEQIGRADELGREAAVGEFVDFVGRADLHDAAFAHDRETIGHRHRFFLIVRDHHAGDVDLLDDVHEFELGLLADLLIERRHRFVEQQQLGALDERTRERDALLLAARELMRLALRVAAHLHEIERVGHAFPDFVLRHPFLLEAERNIRFHAHMRKERIRLEHHVDRTAIGRQRREVLAIDEDLARGGRFQPGEHAQQRGLAAARTAEQREQFILRDVQADVVHGDAVAELLDDVFDTHESVAGGGLRARLRGFGGVDFGRRIHDVTVSFLIAALRVVARFACLPAASRRFCKSRARVAPHGAHKATRGRQYCERSSVEAGALPGKGGDAHSRTSNSGLAWWRRGVERSLYRAVSPSFSCYALSGPSSTATTGGFRGAGFRPASASSASSS
ncbi:hypothetical protein PT2222_100127 [Paraburkholderia tropica]